MNSFCLPKDEEGHFDSEIRPARFFGKQQLVRFVPKSLRYLKKFSLRIQTDQIVLEHTNISLKAQKRSWKTESDKSRWVSPSIHSHHPPPPPLPHSPDTISIR